MPKSPQIKSFSLGLLCTALAYCGGTGKASPSGESPSSVNLSTNQSRTVQSANTNQETPPPADDKPAAEETKPEEVKPSLIRTLSPWLQHLASDPASTTAADKPADKKETKPDANPDASKTTTTTSTTTTTNTKSDKSIRHSFKKPDLEKLMAAATPAQKTEIETYIKQMTAGTATDAQDDAMVSLLQTYKIIAADPVKPEKKTTPPADASKSSSTTTDNAATANLFKDNASLEKTFKSYADIGNVPASFNYDSLHDMLGKDALTAAEQNQLITQFFNIIEDKNAELLKKLPLHDRMVDALNLYIGNENFQKSMDKRFENTPQAKAVQFEIEKKVVTMLSYGFLLNKKVNPNASNLKSEDELIVYTTTAMNVIDDDTKKIVNQKYRTIALGRFDFSNPEKQTLTENETKFTNDLKMIWAAVDASNMKIKPPLDIVGYANKTENEKDDESRALKSADLFKKISGLPFGTVSRSSKYSLPTEAAESSKNNRVEVVILKAKVKK